MKKLKKLALIGLSAIMCLQLAACGNKDSNNDSKNKKDYVYVPEYKSIDSKDGISNIAVGSDIIYYTVGKYDEVTSVYTNELYSIKADEEKGNKVPFEIADNGNIGQMKADSDGNLVFIYNEYSFDEGGIEDLEVSGKEAGDSDEGEDSDDTGDDTEGTDETEVEGGIQGGSVIISSKDKDLVTVAAVETVTDAPATDSSEGTTDNEDTEAGTDEEDEGSSEGEEGSEGAGETNKYFLKKISPSGEELLSVDITKQIEVNGWASVMDMAIDDQYVYILNGESSIVVFDKDGNSVASIKADSESNYIQGIAVSVEGKVVVSTYKSSADEFKAILKEVDVANKKFGVEYENVPAPNGRYTILTGIDKGVIISAGNGVYQYDFDKQESTEILNWLDSDINSDSVSGFGILSDGRIVALTVDYSTEKSETEFIYLTKKPASEVPQKQSITYGAVYVNSLVKREIIKFNKTNEKYRINVTEYGADDYQAGITKLNSDIVAGNAPDIIDLQSLNLKRYSAKGVFEDLYQYIDNDSELNRSDYLENVFKAYEYDGKLVAMAPTFSISTVIGKKSLVGDRTSWTLNDLMELVKNSPEGTEIFEYATKETILNYMCTYSMDSFIDWSSGKCSFDSEEFVKVLEFANTFSSNDEEVYNSEGPGTATKIRSNKLLLLNTYLSDVHAYQMYKEMFAEPISFIGYPTSTGNGSNIEGGNLLLAISSKSKYKDAAWEFMRIFLTEKYQTSDNLWSFPVKKTALDAMMKEAMTPEYYTDESGNKVEQMKTSWSYGNDFEIDIYAAKQEDIDELMELIESVNTSVQYDLSMYDIILEEAQPFFSGQKPAKEVADIIQSRVQIYVNENR